MASGRLGSISTPKIPVHIRLQKGDKFLKWTDQDSNALCVTLQIDKSAYFLRWYDQKNEITLLDIAQIRDVRTGAQAKTPKDSKTREVCSLGPGTLEEKTLTIVYGVDFTNTFFVNFCTNNPEVAKLWYDEIATLIRNSNPLSSNPMSNLRKIYAQIILNCSREDKIPVKSIVKTFCQSKEDRKNIEGALDKSGLPSEKNDTLSQDSFGFEEFLVFYNHLVQRPDIAQVFEKLCGPDKTCIEIKDFLSFLNNTQRDPRLNEILFPFATEETALKLIQRYEPNRHLILKKQLSKDGLLRFLMSEDNLVVSPKQEDSMDRPLPHYFINSSHNTYLTGHQLTGKSSVEMYRQVLLAGCRCVELDFWNGVEEPKIVHGYTIVPLIQAKEVIQAIAESAFKTTDYPLILSFENHCNPKQQAKIADYCKEFFGDALLSYPLDSHPLEKGIVLPSPDDLKGKILIKNKKKKSQSSPEPAAPDTPEVPQPTANGSIPNDGLPSFANSGEEEEESDSSESEVEEDEPDKADHSRTNTLSGTAGKETKAGAEISALVNYVQPVHFKGFKHAKERKRYYEMSSLVETTAYTALKETPLDFVDYNKFQLSRIYPRGTRVDSSNYIPQAFWNTGCQLVALNYQTLDIPMQLNLGIFQLNGGSGFISKPDFMCRDEPGHRKFDPFTESSVDGVVSATVSVKILSGQFLTERRVGTFVEVEMYGLPSDTVCRHKRFRTKLVPNNGISPIFSDEPFIFPQVVVPDLAVIRIAAYEESGKMCGHRVLPVLGLSAGYRHLPLFNESGQPLPLPCLFLLIDVKDYVPNSWTELADALANPIAYQSELEKRTRQLSILRDPDPETLAPTEPTSERLLSPDTASPSKSPMAMVRQGSAKLGGYNKGAKSKDGSPTISQRTDSNKSLHTKIEETTTTLDTVVLTPKSISQIFQHKTILEKEVELASKIESLTKKFHKEAMKLDTTKTNAEDKLTRAPSRSKNALHKASLKIAKKMSSSNFENPPCPPSPKELESRRANLQKSHEEKHNQLERNHEITVKELRSRYLTSIYQYAEKHLNKSQSTQLKTLENLHNQEADQVMKKIEAETKSDDIETPSTSALSREDVLRERRNRLVKRGVAERGRLQELYLGRRNELEQAQQVIKDELRVKMEAEFAQIEEEHIRQLNLIDGTASPLN